MGAEISLDIGGISIDWAKNCRGPDHGFLFQPEDRQRFRVHDLDYESEDLYEHYNKNSIAEWEVGFIRPLRAVVPRLELLGYTLSAAEDEYRCAAVNSVEERKSYRENIDDSNHPALDVMLFEEFRSFVSGITIADLDNNFHRDYDDDCNRCIMGHFTDEHFKSRLPYYEHMHGTLARSERTYFGSLLEFLHPYSMLRILAENQANLEANLEWQYGYLVSSGWAEESEFIPSARRTQTYLIATEGSSDTHILKRAFQLLHPEIADFFRFIDVSERHPFSGTGSLVKFAEGLAKIDVQNRTVFLLDNDAEGISAFRKIENMQLPVNMRALTLPILDVFNAVRTIGPGGETMADINGRAASIECYLDLEAEGVPPAMVRWTNFKDDVDVYQGALLQKDRYSKVFLDQAGRSKTYNTKKLSAVLDAIMSICTLMATDMLDRDED